MSVLKDNVFFHELKGKKFIALQSQGEQILTYSEIGPL
jgi:hypothetical protein